MNENGPIPRGRVSGLSRLLFAYSAAFVIGYGITALIYRFTGQPPALIAHLLTGLTAVSLVMLAWRLIMVFARNNQRAQDQGIHDLLTGALAQMAKGKFDILLDPNTIGAYNELAEAIDSIARNLGTLETMRQDFISNVSHEIQSPLTSISGFAALLQKDGLTGQERRHYAAVIEAESKRLSSLSDNLLKLSTLDNNKIPLARKDFRLDKQLKHAALTLEPQWAAKGITLEAELPKCTLWGDEDLLLQVWVNLLHNAIKFTPDGGRIDIKLTGGNQSAGVRIADTGMGIAPEDRIHIFERFYKVDKARDRSLGGNGLGLSLVKTIIEMHGGNITVESEIGQGTSFQISLPRLHSV